MRKLLIKYSLIFIGLFVTTTMFSQANVVITTTNPANDATVSVTAGGTFDVPFSYTSDEAIILTVQLELVAFGGSGAASYAVPGTEATLNLPATAMASAQTATLTFPTDNPITGTDFGNMSTWTLSPGGDNNNEETGLSVNGSGPNAGYRVKFITDDAADTITGSAGDFPFNQSMTSPTNIEFRDLDFDDIDGVTVPPPPAEIIELVSVLNSASGGTAANPIASVERGATFPVQFTLNTDSEVTKLTVSLNLVGFNGIGRNYDVPGTEVEFNNITSTGGMDQVFMANIPFPTDATILEGGVTWTLDKSQDPTLRPGPQPEALRNDAGSNNTNYRFKFVLDGQTFTSSVANPYIDTVIEEITVNPLSIQDLQAIGIVDAFYNSATQSIDLSSVNTIEKVNVHNISGQIVSSTTVNDRNTSIDLSTLSRGIYIARIDTGSGSAILKLAR